ncbi:fax [Cordylochernes scorpioides]|uniref:Fax n=1 Tax=Cordylochernes scorpioides TaxID=51811 RepID=A0ABY6KG63_9ARAC|nr:fax [Cordylochernes scorpioides]
MWCTYRDVHTKLISPLCCTQNVDHKMKYKSKKGQLPFVELNGAEINDSEMIIKELGKHYNVDLDKDLDQNQRNISHAFISMLNNHTSWVCRWWRYSHPGEFIKGGQVDLKKTLNSKLPKGILNFLFKMGFKSNLKQAVGHGLGRNTEEEIISYGKSDLKVLSDYLADKPYYFGDEPHLLDCVAFAHISQFVYIPFGGIKEYMESDCGNLLTHLERMKNRYWPDWEEACTNLDLNSHLPKPVADEEIKKTPPEDTEEKKAEPEEEKMEEKEPEDKKPVEDEKPQEIKAEQPVATPEEKKD